MSSEKRETPTEAEVRQETAGNRRNRPTDPRVRRLTKEELRANAEAHRRPAGD